jgi:hypothetical protein
VIYPAVHNIRILQNATWRGTYRATQQRSTISGVAVDAGVPTFTSTCHGLTAGTKVVLTTNDDDPAQVPCSLSLNTVYYVIATGLTTDAFRLSTTSGGSSIIVSGTITGTLYAAVPIDLNGYVIDADIKELDTLVQAATFTVTTPNASDGEFVLSLTPDTSLGLSVRDYGYDVSLTSPTGERYYWLTGLATVNITYSRN